MDNIPKFQNYFENVLNIVSKDLQDWKSLFFIFQSISKQDFDLKIFSEHKEFQDIMIHTLRVIYCLMRDSKFQELNEYHKQILLWTALFHDCAKQAPPITLSPDGRDPAHPFKSCHKTLIYLNNLQLIKFTKSQLDLWDYLFKNGYKINQIDASISIKTHNMDILPKLILFIEKEVKSPFFQTVLKLICLHQSIPCTTYPPVSPINLKETSLYFNKFELDLLQIFWYNDSYSYNHTQSEVDFKFGKEIETQIKQAKKNLH